MWHDTQQNTEYGKDHRATVAVTASADGAAFNQQIIFNESAGATFGAATDVDGNIVVTIDSDTDATLASITSAIDGLPDFGAVLTNTDTPPVDLEGRSRTCIIQDLAIEDVCRNGPIFQEVFHPP